MQQSDTIVSLNDIHYYANPRCRVYAYKIEDWINYVREVLAMWELMNGMTNSVRSRMMPRRRNGVGTMTAMLIGASVGIAAWETIRKSQLASRVTSNGNAGNLAQEVMDQIET